MKVYHVTKTSPDFGVSNDYNVVEQDAMAGMKGGGPREFAAKGLTYDQATAMRQELENQQKIAQIVGAKMISAAGEPPTSILQ